MLTGAVLLLLLLEEVTLLLEEETLLLEELTLLLLEETTTLLLEELMLLLIDELTLLLEEITLLLLLEDAMMLLLEEELSSASPSEQPAAPNKTPTMSIAGRHFFMPPLAIGARAASVLPQASDEDASMFTPGLCGDCSVEVMVFDSLRAIKPRVSEKTSGRCCGL